MWISDDNGQHLIARGHVVVAVALLEVAGYFVENCGVLR